ncbi:hypothetical protein SAMN05518856_102203 [Paenibacillus sp. OK003]|uniref:Uncharacterized protein n=1 Tax=Paenibacillus pabuli TaxID=1472 RepID=A0A855Y6C0_9BACL|nr:hypothetical protein DET56_108354 [Paenibacillus pabuli]PXW08388.1 hypothetical protein DEU73_104354 [Paenibacillus taichungensis]RAI99222.1 hypothetical protein DET54_103361 [Paenibacillus pabuli]SEK45239.1 hypothetical protein SAMN05518856_102203 [Paenibacillus sp. OK003]
MHMEYIKEFTFDWMSGRGDCEMFIAGTDTEFTVTLLSR